MDHIPTPKVDLGKTLEQAARFKDVTDRARAARPVDVGRDILDNSVRDPRRLTVEAFRSRSVIPNEDF